MILGFKSTPHQAGHAIGVAVGKLAHPLAEPADQRQLEAAEISRERYRTEVLLLSAAAAMHAVETSGLAPVVESEVASGLFEWVRSLDALSQEVLLSELDKATDYYAEAAVVDASTTQPAGGLSELEASFGERLLGLGQNSEVRGTACVRLSLFIPAHLWSIQHSVVIQMLSEASLLARHDA